MTQQHKNTLLSAFKNIITLLPVKPYAIAPTHEGSLVEFKHNGFDCGLEIEEDSDVIEFFGIGIGEYEALQFHYEYSINDILLLQKTINLKEYMSISSEKSCQTMTIQEALKYDPRVAKLLSDVESGRVMFTAPSGTTESPWTPEKVKELDEFFDKLYESRKNIYKEQ